MPRRALAALLCTVAILFGVVPAARGGDLERRRDEARRKEGEVRRQLDLAHASETDLVQRLAEIDRDLARRRADAEAARVDAEQATASVVDITADVAALRAKLAQRKEVFNRRAVEAYMGGQGRPLDDLAMAGELLAVPHDLSDAARRTEIVKGVSHQDSQVLDELTQARARLANQELVLVMTRDRAKVRATDAARAVKAVAALKQEQEATKAVLDQRIAELTAEADALAAEQAKVEAMIKERLAALAAARAARAARGSPFLSRRPTTLAGVSASGFIWPVQGVLTSGFGPRWGRMHTGIDVAAPTGTPIHAAKEGEVLYAGWMGGYGNLVVLDHGDNLVTLYGHQSRIGVSEGQELNQGDVLGFVGTTGHSTGNHLHFEIRIDAEPRNPRPYLP